MAIAPTLPVPPEIKIVFPFSAFISSNACIRVSAVNGTAAASTSERYSGTFAIAFSFTATYSANAPILSSGSLAKTRSLTLNLDTFAPTFSTTPTNSLPATVGSLYGTIIFTSPREIILSSGFTPAADTLTSTSLSPITGISKLTIFTEILFLLYCSTCAALIFHLYLFFLL